MYLKDDKPLLRRTRQRVDTRCCGRRWDTCCPSGLNDCWTLIRPALNDPSNLSAKVIHAWGNTRDASRLFRFLNRSMGQKRSATFLWVAMTHLTPRYSSHGDHAHHHLHHPSVSDSVSLQVHDQSRCLSRVRKSNGRDLELEWWDPQAEQWHRAQRLQVVQVGLCRVFFFLH